MTPPTRAIRHPQGVSIAVAAKLLRVSVHWLRKQERLGLILRAKRRPVATNERMRWRTYTGEELVAIRQVIAAQRKKYPGRFGLPYPPPKGATKKKAAG